MATKSDYSQQANEICRISYGSSVKGNIVSTSDIRIDGAFKGGIYTTGKVVIGEKAKVIGAVFCQNLDVWGDILGEICCKDSVILKSTSTISGTIKTVKIGIEINAVYNGSCNIITEAEYDQTYSSNCPSNLLDEDEPQKINN